MKREFLLALTQRAVQDLQKIFDFSSEHWGRSLATKYLLELEAGLGRLKKNPDLLQKNPDFHPALSFYRVNRHLIVCDSDGASTIVLTVIHSSMDIPSRLAELQPSLSMEVELLHRQLRKSPSRKS